MIKLLNWFVFLSLAFGVISGIYFGTLIEDEFSLVMALPSWIGGFVSAVIFAVLAEVLEKVRNMHVKMFHYVKTSDVKEEKAKEPTV